jgi:hypothetical protein
MTDSLTTEQRSERMRCVRQRDTSLEVQAAVLLRQTGASPEIAGWSSSAPENHCQAGEARQPRRPVTQTPAARRALEHVVAVPRQEHGLRLQVGVLRGSMGCP